MGVYYGCSSCGVTLHLAPGAPGFGQLRIDCPKCGSEARYSPSGPKAGEVVDVGVPGAETARPDRPSISSAMLSSVLGTTNKSQGPSPTVPLQMSQDMLDLDRVETAPTVPVEGLTNAQLAALARRKPAADEPSNATERIEGIAPLISPPPSDTANDYDPTTQMPGLSEEMLSSISPDEVPAPPPPSAVEPSLDAGSGPLSDVDEDKIPTRSLEGLSDREVTSYARELYTEEGVLEPTGAVEGLRERPSPEDKIAQFKAEKAAREAESGPLVPSGPSLSVPESIDNPSYDLGSEASPSVDGDEPGLSPSMFVRSPLAGAEPRLTGANPRVVPSTSEPGLRTPPPTEAPETLAADFRGATPQPGRSTLKRGASVGIVFITVFFLALFIFVVGGLVVMWKSMGSDEGVEEKPAESVTEPVARHTRFGLPALDEASPFRVGNSTISIRDTGGGFAKLTLTGTLENGGINSIDHAELGGTFAVAVSAGESQSFPMTGTLKPSVARKRAWAPGKSRKFTLEATQIPAEIMSAKASDRFVWLTLKARNGSVFTYDEAFAAIDVKQ